MSSAKGFSSWWERGVDSSLSYRSLAEKAFAAGFAEGKEEGKRLLVEGLKKAHGEVEKGPPNPPYPSPETPLKNPAVGERPQEGPSLTAMMRALGVPILAVPPVGGTCPSCKHPLSRHFLAADSRWYCLEGLSPCLCKDFLDPVAEAVKEKEREQEEQRKAGAKAELRELVEAAEKKFKEEGRERPVNPPTYPL